jgi:hypothetical protein
MVLLPIETRLPQVTNDIFTKEDALFLTRNEALPAERIRAVQVVPRPIETKD